MAQSDVETLLPLITPFAAPADPSMATLYDIAKAQVDRDASTCSGSTRNLAETYYVAHLLFGGDGKTGIKSEKIDDYSIGYVGEGFSDAYLENYNAVIEKCLNGVILTPAAIGVQTRIDDLSDLDLDAGGIVGE